MQKLKSNKGLYEFRKWRKIKDRSADRSGDKYREVG